MEEPKRSVIGESSDNLSQAENEILTAILKAGTIEVPKSSNSKPIEIGLDSQEKETATVEPETVVEAEVEPETDADTDAEPKSVAESETSGWDEVAFSPEDRTKEESTSAEEPVSKDE